MLQFKVVCYKKDIGIFTCYGAKVTHTQPTPPNNNYVQHPHQPLPPIYKDTTYTTTLYTNPELTQSLVICQDKNRDICTLILNNFIKLALSGKNVIDIDKINCKTEIKMFENIYDQFGKDPCHPWFNEDCDPFHNPWDRFWQDPHKKPNVDVFDRRDPHPFDPKHPHCPPPPPDLEVIDPRLRPLPDGDIYHCHPPKNPYDRFFDIERSITKVIPGTLERILHEITPNEPKPDHTNKIVYYYGNGGAAMGGSVMTNINELSEYALYELLKKNGGPTKPNASDKINVQRMIADTILISEEYAINKTTNNDYAFFMIPDSYVSLIEDFTFYTKASSNAEWVEVTNTNNIERKFTIQSNGIRYYIIAMRFNSDISAIKFAKSASSSGGSTTWAGIITLKVITTDPTVRLAYVSPDGTNTNITLDSNNESTISNLVSLTEIASGKYYELVKLDESTSTATTLKYFAVTEGTDGATKLYVKDNSTDEGVLQSSSTLTITID